MSIQFLKSLLVVCGLFLMPLSITHCTSSDDETSVLEEELENIDVEGADEDTMVDDIEDLGEIAEEDLVDELDEEDGSEDDNSEEVAELDDDELDEEDSDEEFEDGDQEVADNESDDDEEFEDDDQEMADSDEDFDEFDEFDDEEGEDKKEFAQNEKSLEEELNQKANEEYPVVEDAQPAFPEEVIGQNEPPVPPVGPLATDGTITSETQEIAVTDPVEPQLPQDDLGEADPIVPLDEEDEVKVQSWVPVVKIKADPFFRNQRLMNGVYIARPKDTLDSISEKIFGTNRAEELKSDNPHLAKGIDPGDKVYYNSPNRPSDKTQLKFFYADIGLQPQFYQTRDGDNMRRLGSKLLGFPEGWKEVWAINANVDSKTILPSGLEVKYWTGDEQNVNTPIATNEDLTNKETEMPATTAQVEEFEDLPPEPPLPEAQIAMPENNLEPEVVPDIEPFPEQGIEQTPTPVVTAVNQNESLLSVGAMALLLIAGVGLVAIQIKKRKDNTGMRPQSLEYTQV